MTILIVDDDEVSRVLLGNVLGSLADVEVAGDGQAAWELLEGSLRPDVCCCDVRMPILDGLGLMERVRGHAVLYDLPFVLISAASDPETVRTAITRGAAGYILKPFRSAQTRTTVDRVLRQRQAEEAEAAGAARRRLGVSQADMDDMLLRLRDDAAACAADGEVNAAARVRALRRLHGSTLLLGLWRCTALLETMLSPAGADRTRCRLVLEEVRRLTEARIESLSSLVPLEDGEAAAQVSPSEDADAPA